MIFLKRVIFSKRFAVIIVALLQVLFFAVLMILLANWGIAGYTIITIFSALVMFFLLSSDDLNPAYKLVWLMMFVLLPVVGVLFYLMWGHRTVPKKRLRQMEIATQNVALALPQNERVMQALEADNVMLHRNANYLLQMGKSPVYPADGVSYYPLGEDFFEDFLQEIQKAKNYIFMRYYIIEEGEMLGRTLEILKQKVAEGVDVRIMWDGFGCLLTLPEDYPETLRAMGIQCAVFSPVAFTAHVSDYAMLNHRDHSKISVIDGKVGFSGGINFADEYINAKVRFGQWKDTAVMVRGEAAASLAGIFLIGWDFVTGTVSDIPKFLPEPEPFTMLSLGHGYVQPYWDSPLDTENISENAYLNTITQATDYVYISTPYLILDHEMISALCLAAKSGVDVRLLTPGIPDKRTIYWISRSYYPILLENGVRIFEYTPGFNHAKMYVSDDKTAIVGTANMDYRSFYLHFENSVVFYGGSIIRNIKHDLVDCFKDASEVSWQEATQIPFHVRLIQIAAKLLSPFL